MAMVRNGYGTKMIFTMVRNDCNSDRVRIPCVHKIYVYTCKHEISYKLQLCSNNIKITDN